jgi:hypothetical protein
MIFARVGTKSRRIFVRLTVALSLAKPRRENPWDSNLPQNNQWIPKYQSLSLCDSAAPSSPLNENAIGIYQELRNKVARSFFY